MSLARSDKHGLSFNGVVDTLLAMANYRPMPETSIIHFVQYPADTLYILTENRDTVVAQLMDLGKKWRADEVSAFDGSLEEEADWKFRNYVHLRLQEGLWGKNLRSRSRCHYRVLLVGLAQIVSMIWQAPRSLNMIGKTLTAAGCLQLHGGCWPDSSVSQGNQPSLRAVATG
jgi:hypothetical protein